MKYHLFLIGNKFINNIPLQTYILRSVQKNFQHLSSIRYFTKSDNTLLLALEDAINLQEPLLIVSSKKNFSTIGKVLSTLTEDIQILKEGMLIPSKSSVFDDRTYLLEYNKTKINVIQIDENEHLPLILLSKEENETTFHVFEEDAQGLQTILNPIAQTYEVYFEITQIVDGWLRVDVQSNKYGKINNFIAAVGKLLAKKTIHTKDLVPYIINRLAQNHKKITFAESCTGGLLSYFFTKHNGASVVLDGALVTYSNALKENWLAVSESILQEHGAVSSAVVAEMSEGALNVSEADYAIAISGIAGDGGGTEEKPVGTVYIGVRSQLHHKEQRCFFQGDRNYIQEQSALYALKMVVLLDKETFF